VTLPLWVLKAEFHKGIENMFTKELLDKDVIGLNGIKIGKSKDVFIDPLTWQVTYLYVELKGNIAEELGMPSTILFKNNLPLSISHIQGVGDLITLKSTKEEIIAILSDFNKSQQKT
jgi:sporulation protein YlmC with PRC-barrel domain